MSVATTQTNGVNTARSAMASRAEQALSNIDNMIGDLESAKTSLLEEQREMIRGRNKQLDEIDAEISKLDTALEKLGARVIRFRRGARIVDGRSTPAQVVVRRRTPGGVSTKEAVLKVLGANSDPLSVDVILSRLEGVGWTSGSTNRRAVVSQALGALKKNSEIINPTRGHYTLA